MEDSEALVKAAAEVSKLDKEKILAAKQNLKQIVSEKVALLSRAEGELKQKLSEIELREDDESKELRYAMLSLGICFLNNYASSTADRSSATMTVS